MFTCMANPKTAHFSAASCPVAQLRIICPFSHFVPKFPKTRTRVTVVENLPLLSFCYIPVTRCTLTRERVFEICEIYEHLARLQLAHSSKRVYVHTLFARRGCERPIFPNAIACNPRKSCTRARFPFLVIFGHSIRQSKHVPKYKSSAYSRRCSF